MFDDGGLREMRTAHERLDTVVAELREAQRRDSRRIVALQVTTAITSISLLMSVLLISSTFRHINNTIAIILRMIGK